MTTTCIRKDCSNPRQGELQLLMLLCKEHETALRDKWLKEAKAPSEKTRKLILEKNLTAGELNELMKAQH